MDYNSLKLFVDSINNELFTPPNNIVEDYIINDFEIPFYLNWVHNYDRLKEIHKNIIKNLKISKDLIEYENVDDIIYELLKLKLIVDNLIQNHKKDQKKNLGKFKKDSIRKEGLKKLETLQFHSSRQGKKTITIFNIYRYLVKSKRVTNDPIQRKAFIALFFEQKINKTYINWYNNDVDLRAFLTGIINCNIIKYNASDINQFAFENFKNLDSKGNLKLIKKNTFRSYQDKPHFRDSLSKWTESLLNIM